MARGGFRRLVKLSVTGCVLDHRPDDTDHPDVKADPSAWISVEVPRDIPVSLNEGIRAGVLTVRDGRVEWVPDAAARVEALRAEAMRPRPDRVAELESRLAALEQAVKP